MFHYKDQKTYRYKDQKIYRYKDQKIYRYIHSNCERLGEDSEYVRQDFTSPSLVMNQTDFNISCDVNNIFIFDD